MLLYQSLITAIAVFLLLNTLNNLHVLKRPVRLPPPVDGPLVSVLIPARNEERSIARCVESLVRQEYPHLEILVLDDHSEDKTAAIVKELAERYPSVRLLQGQPLPPAWHGKAYACAQLAWAAKGDWLLFVDADTIHAPTCVSTALHVALEQQADLLTMLPRVLEQSFGEALLLPLVLLPFATFLPMGVVNGRHLPTLSGALGPFLLFHRDAYQRLGGHAAVRADLVEDMQLGRLVKQHGGRLIWIDGTDLMQIRFYHTFGEAWRGLAKSAFAELNYSLSALFMGLLGCIALFLAPYAFLLAGLLNQRLDAAWVWLPLSQILLAWTFRLLVAQRFHQHRLIVFLHPITMLATMLLTTQAAYQATFGAGVVWKGRAYHFNERREGVKVQKHLAMLLPAVRLALAGLLVLLGWRWGVAALEIAALALLSIWTCALLEQALGLMSRARLSVVAEYTSGLGSLSYLLLSGQMTLWLALVAALFLLVGAMLFHWRNLPLISSITLGSLLLLIGGTLSPLIRIFIIWWVLGTLFLTRSAVGHFLGTWYQRLRPPL
jgi:chlorobactene glucosyltransferase